MSRNTDPAVTSASQLPQLRYRPLCEVWSLQSGVARTCAGDRFIVVGATTYSPVGNLGGFEKVREEADPFPRSLRIWFAAVNSAAIADVLAESLFQKPIKLYRNFLTESYTLVGTPQLMFVGYVSTVELKLKDRDRGNYFEVEADSRLRQPTRARYYNKETLWKAMGFSGDTFYNYRDLIPNFTSAWGNLSTGITYGGQRPLPPFDPNSLPNFFF